MAEPDFGRVKRNISRMIDMGAPEFDIDSYLKTEGVTPDQLRAVPNASAAPVAPVAPDVSKYQQAAQGEQQKLKAAGVDTNEGYGNKFLRGITMGASGDILSGLSAPLEMVKHGTMSPIEGYKYAKARDELIAKQADEKTGGLGTAVEMGAGLGGGLALANKGVTFLKGGMSLGQKVAAGAKEGAAYGGLTGFFGGGDNLSDKANSAGKGILAGALLGGAIPAVGAGVSTAAAPVLSNIRARVNPEGFALSKFTEALRNSGRTPQEIEQALADAHLDGQSMFTMADAMGNAGQRSLSTITRAPGPARQGAVEFLDARQAGQSRRIANTLAEGFEAPQTAMQTEQTMKAARSADANINYGAAREQSGAVDVSPALRVADETLQPGVSKLFSPSSGLADSSIESTLRRAKSYLTDGKSVLSDFQGALRAKQEIDAMIDTAAPTVQKHLIPFRNALDESLASASAPYAAARDQFRQASKAIDAVQTGKTAAMRGRTEDTLQKFGGLSTPAEQQGFRVGYVDPLIEQTQTAGMGVNKARTFTSDAMKTELPAFSAPGKGDQMMRRIDRENTMFTTRAEATGGSKTADNLADAADSKIDPTFIASLLAGNVGPALGQVGRMASNAAGGLTPNVRQELAKLLLSTHSTSAPVNQSIAKTVAQKAKMEAILNALQSGGYAAGGQYLQKR